MQKYAKAIVAFFVPALTSVGTALGNGVSGTELLKASLTGLITSLVVWAVPNKEDA